MIITRTPLRISLCGGGTDMPAFYSVHGGAVVSFTIDKYMYVSVNRKFDGRIRLSYSRTENVESPGQLKHDLARTCLQVFDEHGLEITSVADIPGAGSGLGSSSAFTVGLLLALSELQAKSCGWSPKSLAEMAYIVEHWLCGHETGKQDQYAAAYGGFHFYEFCPNGHVRVMPFDLPEDEMAYLGDRLMLFWTGKTRKAAPILTQQSTHLAINQDHIETARIMRGLADQLRNDLCAHRLENIGVTLNSGWMLKKQLADGISNTWIDEIYHRALVAGAQGGKICGAGGGGFLLLWAEPNAQPEVERAVGLRRVPFRFEGNGSSVIYRGEG